MPKRDRQRERRERRLRAAMFGPRPTHEDLEGIPYRRKCHQCGRQAEGLVGSFGGVIPASAAPALQLLTAEHGHFVCATCDPEANMQWLLDIQSHLEGRPFDED